MGPRNRVRAVIHVQEGVLSMERAVVHPVPMGRRVRAHRVQRTVIKDMELHRQMDGVSL